MTSFPTVYHLAAATDEEVNAHWAGLGFYRRARLLHQGAKYVVNELNGVVPTQPEQLLTIQGIGPYTAAAIASIAFNVCVPVVDGNVCRVLSRLTGIANHIKHPILKDKLGWRLASQIVEAGDGSHPGLVNQALMELGATYCAPSGTGIDPSDPLKDYYMSTKLGIAYLDAITRGHQKDGVNGMTSLHHSITTPRMKGCDLCDPDGMQAVWDQFQRTITHNTTYEEAAICGHSAFPTDPPKNQKREEDLAMAVITTRPQNSAEADDEIRYLMVKRPEKGLLAGQWEFPNVCVQIRDNGKNNEQKNAVANKAPTKGKRHRALTEYLLDDVFVNYPNANVVSAIQKMPPRVNLESISGRREPLEHIFSHVRHIMWIEMGVISSLDIADGNDDDDVDFSLRMWTTASGRQARWMNQSDMDTVGITSGVKKVLNTVCQIIDQQQPQPKQTKTGTMKRRKR
jgi:A/G-specific adenine glycosylase